MMASRLLIFRTANGGGIRAHSNVSHAQGDPMIRKLRNLAALAGATLCACWNLAVAQTPMPPCLAVDASPPPSTCGTGPAPFLGNSMQGVSIVTVSAGGGNNWLQFQGTDTKYGNVLPRAPASLWGGTGANDQIQQIYNSPGDITEAIATDNTVPAGVSNRVRVTTAVNPYSSPPNTQDSYLEQPGSAPQGMFYESYWIWLQPDLPSRTSGNTWGELVEFKAPGGARVERFQIGWWMANWTGYGATTPCITMMHDDTTNGYIFMESVMNPNGNTGGMGQTYAAPLPLGQWFKLEWAFNRSDSAGQGWMWAALTVPGSSNANLRAGVQIFALRGAFNYNGQTLGMNASQPSQLINRIFLDNSSYGNFARSSSSPYVIKTTDYQVYTSWPATATAHPSDFN